MTIKEAHRPVAAAPVRRTAPAARPAVQQAVPVTRTVERGKGASSSHLSALASNFGTPQSVHITQEADRRYNPGGNPDRYNGDCGPAALVMGLDMLGLRTPGRSVQERINNSRLNMNRSQPEQDGLTPDGRFSNREHREATSYGQVLRGARAAGADGRFVRSLDDVRSAVQVHSPVLALGNPSASYGRRVGVEATEHFIAVTGYDQASGQYTINDPLRHEGPMQITPAELETFMARGPGRGYYLVLERS